MCLWKSRNSVMSMSYPTTSPEPMRNPTGSASPVSPARSVNWFLACVLGVVALIRPVVRIVASESGYEVSPVLPVLLTIGITAVWIIAVVSARAASPVLTLVVAGLVYAVLSTVLSGILSPILDGELSGPLANPIAIVPMLLINALWGLVAGGIARIFQRRVSPRS